MTLSKKIFYQVNIVSFPSLIDNINILQSGNIFKQMITVYISKGVALAAVYSQKCIF